MHLDNELFRNSVKSILTTNRIVTLLIILSIIVGLISPFISPIILILISLGLILLTFISKNPFIGYLIFIFFIPIEILSVLVSSSVSVLRYLSIGLVAIWAVNKLVYRSRINFVKQSFWYLLFFLWSFLSILWAPAPQFSFSWALAFLQFFFLIIVSLDLIKTKEQLKMVIIALFLGGVVDIIIFYFLGEFNNQSRLVFLSIKDGSGLAFYGYPLAYSISLMGAFFLFGKGWFQRFGFLFFVAGIFPLIATGLRGALLAVIISIIISFFIFEKKKKTVYLLFVILLLFSIFLFTNLSQINLLPDSLIQRLTLLSIMESKASNRFIIWEIAINIFVDNPIFGLGLNQFSAFALHQNLYGYVGSHNDYLEAFVSLGIIGGILLIGGDFYTLSNLIKTQKKVKKDDIVWVAIIFIIFIAVIIGQNSVNQIVWKYVWVIRALAIVCGMSNFWIPEKKILI